MKTYYVAVFALVVGIGTGILCDKSEVSLNSSNAAARVQQEAEQLKAANDRAVYAQALEFKTAQTLAETRNQLSEASENEQQAEGRLQEAQTDAQAATDAIRQCTQDAPVEVTPVTTIFSDQGPAQAGPIQNFCRTSASPEWCAEFLQAAIAQLGQSQKPSDRIGLVILKTLLR